MKKLIIVLLVIDTFVFSFGASYVGGVRSPQYFSFLIFAQSDYSAAIYKSINANVSLKLVRLANDMPHVEWEKKLSSRTLDLYPGQQTPITRKINLGMINDETDYLVYRVVYETKGAPLIREDALLIDKSEPVLKIGL